MVTNNSDYLLVLPIKDITMLLSGTEEVNNFINEIFHGDMVRGMFLVFDNVLSGYTISEAYYSPSDEITNELTMEVGSKIASISAGMFHLVKYNNSDKTYFIVGNIIDEIDSRTGYDLQGLIDFMLADVRMYDDEDGLSQGIIKNNIVIFDWDKIVSYLNDEKLLERSLVRISASINKHESFLLEYANDYFFYGLCEGVVDSDEHTDQNLEQFTDQNLEQLFGAFIRYIDKNIVPKLKINIAV